MLIFGRREGEGFYIGKDVYVTILVVEHGKVSVGIDAPSYVSVDREEVRIRKERNNQLERKS